MGVGSEDFVGVGVGKEHAALADQSLGAAQFPSVLLSTLTHIVLRSADGTLTKLYEPEVNVDDWTQFFPSSVHKVSA